MGTGAHGAISKVNSNGADLHLCQGQLKMGSAIAAMHANQDQMQSLQKDTTPSVLRMLARKITTRSDLADDFC